MVLYHKLVQNISNRLKIEHCIKCYNFKNTNFSHIKKICNSFNGNKCNQLSCCFCTIHNKGITAERLRSSGYFLVTHCSFQSLFSNKICRCILADAYAHRSISQIQYLVNQDCNYISKHMPFTKVIHSL